MIHLAGTYYDGADSSPESATLEVYEAEVILRLPNGKHHLAAADIHIDAKLGNTPRTITWGGVERFVTMDHSNADALQNTLPKKSQLAWVSWLEQKTIIAIVALVVAAGSAASVAIWGVPFMAKTVAYGAPESVSSQLGESTLATIDQILEPSQIDAERQQALISLFRAHGEVPVIEFRHAERLGPNALTLSATTIVMTDQLVTLAENDNELLAVYLHELGHARLRHVERTILHNGAWVVMLSVILGDISAAGDLILTLPLVVGQAAYSREFEREADHFAIAELQAAGIEPMALAEILERMEAFIYSAEEDSDHSDACTSDDTDATIPSEQDEESVAIRLLEYLSSHPATQERITYIRRAQTN